MSRYDKKKAFRMFRTLAVSGVILCMTGLCACDADPGQDAEYQPVPEEKKLVVYTSHKEEVYGPIIKEFEERTGIWVQVRAGGTTELLEEIAEEAGEAERSRKPGNGGCDVMFGGGVESYAAYRDCFQPYRCSQYDELEDDFISEEGEWTVFSQLPIVFIYNNKLVSQKDAPKTWQEFLTDRWKGQIAFANPGKSGTSCTALSAMIQVLGKTGREEEVLGKFLAALDGKTAAGSGAVLDEVSSGKRLVGITLEETARKRIAGGADISMIYPAEGTSMVPDGSALVKGAPHEENGKLFIDFTVSEDVQKLLVSQCCRRSVRRDVKETETETGRSRTNSLKVMDFDLDWASLHQQEILELWDRLLNEQKEAEGKRE